MRYITTTFTLLLAINTCWAMAGGQDTPNQVDPNGLKQGHWVIINTDKHLPGYSEKDKIEEGDYSNNLKQGVWIEYFPGGAIRNKITFKDNRPEGYTISYYQNGKVCEEGIWKNNRWVGDYKLYYENGNVQHQFHYTDNGKRDGEQKYFNDKGQVIIDGNWTGGKQTGATTEYYDDGSIKAKEVFNNGALDTTATQKFAPKNITPTTDNAAKVAAKDAPKTPVTVVKTDEKPNTAVKPFDGEGYWKLYNKNKQIAKDGYFHQGHLTDGKDYIYNEDGILQRITVWKNGVYQGDAPITEDDKK